MNCESTVLSLITTAYGPEALIDATFESGDMYPIMSSVLSCLPAVRL